MVTAGGIAVQKNIICSATGSFDNLVVRATTASTTTATGALVVGGGVGIGGLLQIGGPSVIDSAGFVDRSFKYSIVRTCALRASAGNYDNLFTFTCNASNSPQSWCYLDLKVMGYINNTGVGMSFGTFILSLNGGVGTIIEQSINRYGGYLPLIRLYKSSETTYILQATTGNGTWYSGTYSVDGWFGGAGQNGVNPEWVVSSYM